MSQFDHNEDIKVDLDAGKITDLGKLNGLFINIYLLDVIFIFSYLGPRPRVTFFRRAERSDCNEFQY